MTCNKRDELSQLLFDVSVVEKVHKEDRIGDVHHSCSLEQVYTHLTAPASLHISHYINKDPNKHLRQLQQGDHESHPRRYPPPRCLEGIIGVHHCVYRVVHDPKPLCHRSRIDECVPAEHKDSHMVVPV